MQLKNADFKLLRYLYHNDRESYSKIAKATGLSREQVQYKIKNYLKTGIIRKFSTVFNYSKLGYDYFVTLLIRFDSVESKTSFVKSLENCMNCISWGKAYARYDIYANYIFKDEKGFNSYLENVVADDYMIIKPAYSVLYPLKFFKDKKEDLVIIDTKDQTASLDDKDKKLMAILQSDNRARIIDIANALKISSELALYKLRRLYKEKIILGSRIQFDMNKLDQYFTLVIIRHNMDAQTTKKLKMLSKESKNINSLIIQTSKSHYILQLFHSTEKELRKEIENINVRLPKAIIEIIPIGEDIPLINTLPFIR